MKLDTFWSQPVKGFTEKTRGRTEQAFERLTKLGVEFSMKPTEMEMVKMAVFNNAYGDN